MAEPLRPAFSRRSRATAGGHGGNVTGMGNRHGRMATCDGEGTCSLEALRRDGAGAGIGIEACTVGSSVRRAAGERGQEPGRTEDASEGGRMEAEAGAGISGCRRLGRLASRKPSHGETLLSAKSSQPATTYSKSTFSGLTPSRRTDPFATDPFATSGRTCGRVTGYADPAEEARRRFAGRRGLL